MIDSNVTIPDDLISTQEAAGMMQVTPNTLTCWRKIKRGPNYYKIGRQCRYSRAELAAYIVNNCYKNICGA